MAPLNAAVTPTLGADPPEAPAPSRPIVYRTRGHRHGPITRLMSPGDLGERVKPFIFLDLFEAERTDGPGFAPHPHSGIATLTTFLDGHMTYADSTGKKGALSTGAVEWMRAGGGVWHAGEPVGKGAMRGYQLWTALPPELELAPPESLYVEPSRITADGPVRVLLGSYGGRTSPLPSPSPMTYLHVRLQHGRRWTYSPAPGHDVAWLAVNSGRLHTADAVLEREMAVFADGGGDIEMVADGAVELVIGSAAKHPHPLVSGHYSVHTNRSALIQGERNIAELATTPKVAALQKR